MNARGAFRGGVEVVLLGAIAATWLLLLVVGSGGGHHHTLAAPGSPIAPGGLWAEFLVFATGWALMSAAMMLPVALPFVRGVAAEASRAPATGRRVGPMIFFCVLGYLSLWWLIAAPTFALSLLVGLVSAEGAATIAAVAVAVLYQATPVKRRFLRECRYTRLAQTSSTNLAAAARLGARYGVRCVGCCWALMLVMAVAGSAGVVPMVILTAVMLVERSLARRPNPLRLPRRTAETG